MTPNEPDSGEGDDLTPYEVSPPEPKPAPLKPQIKYPELLDPSPRESAGAGASGTAHDAAALQAVAPSIDDDGVRNLLRSAALGRDGSGRWKNWRLEGSGFSPFAIYGSALGLVVLWAAGACVLGAFGPWGTLLVLAVLFGAVWYASARQQLRESREAAGECPTCGYDLRATPAICPECGKPVPDSILRRRRNVERIKQLRSLGAPPDASD